MKNHIVMCVVVATAAVALKLDGALAFASDRSVAARPLRTALLPVQDHNGLFPGIGTVTAIDPANGSLTINHQEIVGLMPPMEMLFHVNPRTLSDGVKPGDRIEFWVEDKTYTIRDIRPVEPTR